MDVSGEVTCMELNMKQIRDSRSHVHGVDDTDVPCAVCHVSNRTAVYMVPAKYTCPTGWTIEYNGYLMSSYSSHRRTVFTCMDIAFKSVVGSSSDRDSLIFYSTL